MILIVRRRGRRERGQIQQEMEQMFRSLVSGARTHPTSHFGTWRPAVEVYEEEETLVVRAELAGVRESDLQISIDDSVLRITGVRYAPESTCKRLYHQTGVPYGDFEAEIFIPYSVELDNVEAHYEYGFLSVVLPKRQPTRIIPNAVRSSETEEPEHEENE